MTAAESERPPTFPTSTGPSVDELLDIVANERRRLVIRIIDECGPTKLKHVSESIAAAENDCDAAALRSQQKKRVYVGLWQHHLPKLRKFGYLADTENEHDIQPGPRFDEVVTLLDAMDVARSGDTEDPDASLIDRLLGGVFA